MALVMLPCDLPWWSNVQKKLAIIEKTESLDEIMEQMQKIHDLCNVSLDPDEDDKDTTLFDGFRLFVETMMDEKERKHFLGFTITNIAKRAQDLKLFRPPRGLSFSLQQQPDNLELDYRLVASLLANAFFSTFPKRTEKTHPTLQDFNFTYFFSGLADNNVQKAKLRSFLYYFDWLETQGESQEDCIKISRKVMTGKQWLTIEDWQECELPLCDLEIKHEGKLEKSKADAMQTVFAKARLGGDVLGTGSSQESIQFFTFPEMLAVLLYVEALEDNESLQVDNVRNISRIIDPKGKGIFEKLEVPKKTSLCCIDAENYKELPAHQFEEDNVLRELNKCLLAFRQNTVCPSDLKEKRGKENQEQTKGRLSPIGEREREGSSPGSPTDAPASVVVRQATNSSKRSSNESNIIEKDINKRRSMLAPDIPALNSFVSGPLASGRKGRFIVLGSSGECLPVNRHPLKVVDKNSLFSSCDSSQDEFHSARDSFEDDEEDCNKRYSLELETPERRFTFAQTLKKALQSDSHCSDSTDSSYAVGISVTGSQTGDQDIRLRRGGSRGFMLTDDSTDEGFFRYNSEDRELVEQCREKQNGILERKNTNDSSKYSFDSELGSELEEVYEQFAKWLEDPLLGDKNRELEPRDEALLQFAGSLLKRTLSESFVGVPFAEGSLTNADDTFKQDELQNQKIILNARSLSLELAKHKHKLAAQLKKELNELRKRKALKNQIPNNDLTPKPPPRRKKKPKPNLSWSISHVKSEENVKCEDVVLKISQLMQKRSFNINLRPISTGNWGCGQSKRGDVQLKMVIQWLASSVAGLPYLIYYTAGDEKLSKLDTVCRLLLDRKCTVGELVGATLAHAYDILANPIAYNNNKNNDCLFDKLIGIDRV